MLDEKRLGAGVRPTFHNHPEELVVCNSGELDAHHIYRHNDALEHHTQQRAVSATNNSTNKQVRIVVAREGGRGGCCRFVGGGGGGGLTVTD